MRKNFVIWFFIGIIVSLSCSTFVKAKPISLCSNKQVKTEIISFTKRYGASIEAATACQSLIFSFDETLINLPDNDFAPNYPINIILPYISGSGTDFGNLYFELWIKKNKFAPNLEIIKNFLTGQINDVKISFYIGKSFEAVRNQIPLYFEEPKF